MPVPVAVRCFDSDVAAHFPDFRAPMPQGSLLSGLYPGGPCYDPWDSGPTSLEVRIANSVSRLGIPLTHNRMQDI